MDFTRSENYQARTGHGAEAEVGGIFTSSAITVSRTNWRFVRLELDIVPKDGVILVVAREPCNIAAALKRVAYRLDAWMTALSCVLTGTDFFGSGNFVITKTDFSNVATLLNLTRSCS